MRLLDVTISYLLGENEAREQLFQEVVQQRIDHITAHLKQKKKECDKQFHSLHELNKKFSKNTLTEKEKKDLIKQERLYKEMQTHIQQQETLLKQEEFSNCCVAVLDPIDENRFNSRMFSDSETVLAVVDFNHQENSTKALTRKITENYPHNKLVDLVVIVLNSNTEPVSPDSDARSSAESPSSMVSRVSSGSSLLSSEGEQELPEKFEGMDERICREIEGKIQGNVRYIKHEDISKTLPILVKVSSPGEKIRSSLLQDLKKYTDRIEKCKDTQGTITALGLNHSLFLGSQLVNRRANYQLAQSISEELKNSTDIVASLKKIVTTYQKTKGDFLAVDKNKSVCWTLFWSKGVNSHELKAILHRVKDLAEKFAKQEKAGSKEEVAYSSYFPELGS